MESHRRSITSNMKRALTIVAVAVALPLLAEEPAKKTEEKPERKPATLSVAPASQPATAADSPLVAAARRSTRLGKKPTNVITDKNLKKVSDAHITTTENQRTLNMPPRPSPSADMIVAQKRNEDKKRRDAEIQRQREAAEKRQHHLANAAQRAEEGLYEDGEGEDEAAGERDLQKANAQKPPQF